MTPITRVRTKAIDRTDGANIFDQQHAPVTRWVDEPVDLVAIYDNHPQVCCLRGPSVPAIGLRLSRLDRAMCPRFHVDHVAIRMTCTYTGPATEWIDRDIRHNGGQLDIDPSRQPVRCAEPGALVFLKGGQWTGNSGRGTVHRSPDAPTHGGHRVLLIVDAIWQP